MGKTTGFKYILSKGSPKETLGQYQNKLEAPGESNQQQAKESGSTNQQQTEVPTGTKTVYLTFDDGPNNLETPMILDILDSYGVKGTFFVVGTNIEQYPGVFKEEIRRGHGIGNHTYDHKYTEVYASYAAFLESIKQNEELIFQIGGIRPKIVRDPGGEVRNNKVLKDLLAQNGYSLVDWNVDSYDSRKPGLDGAQIVESVRRQTAKPNIQSHMIVLMHDGKGHMNTVRALPTVIEMLKNQGFKFAILK
jgi:peptidoglycan/xylan/chitin deacetylase (PgdA/CDA1 family)